MNAMFSYSMEHRKAIGLFGLWLGWILTGGIFYAKQLDVGWEKGFYHAVSVGYSVGWGDISEKGNTASQIFSILYVFIGAAFVGIALGEFGNYVSQERDQWYENEMQRLVLRQNADNMPQFILSWCIWRRELLAVIALWFTFVIAGAICAFALHQDDGWSFVNAVYFSISSLSTGGLYPIDSSAEDWEYGMIAAFCAVGIPIHVTAMCAFASLLVNVGSVDDAVDSLKEPITEKEIEMLRELGIVAKSDPQLDKLDFLVLCVVRIGAISPELVQFIISYFSELDADGNGKLSVDELCHRLSDMKKQVSDNLLRNAASQHSDRLLKTNQNTRMHQINEKLSLHSLATSFKGVSVVPHEEVTSKTAENQVIPIPGEHL